MRKVLLMIILFIGGLLRLVSLDRFPAGLNADEAALGYNAYSLIETGKDEHGNSWPVNLESFGDFKPAGYAYILIPFIKIIGLNEWAVRLPSALFGIFSIYLIYKLSEKTIGAALVSATVLAVSPWHIHFSRGAWEVNVANTLIILGVVFFLNWLSSKKIQYALAGCLTFVSSMYIYQSARIITPILILVLVCIFWKDVITRLLHSFLVCSLSLLLLLPLISSIIHSDAGSRINGVGIFADEGPINRVNQLRGQHIEVAGFLAKLLHNKQISYSTIYIQNYLEHFNGDFLFVNGDKIERNKVPETGLLYISDTLLIFIGLVILFRKNSKNKVIVFVLLGVAPMASALTFQTPHALRAHLMVFPLAMLTGFGLKEVSRYKSAITVSVIILLYTWQVGRYLHEYFVHYPKTYPSAWEYGFKDLVTYVSANEKKYDSIIVTNRFDQPYILFLFYLKYPPQKFQNNHVLTFRDKFNFSTVNNFGKYTFKSIEYEKDKVSKNTLIVGTKNEIPDTEKDIIKIINFPNDIPAFKIVESK